jgi:hypothetical protein
MTGTDLPGTKLQKESLRVDPFPREDSGQALPRLARRLTRDDKRGGWQQDPEGHAITDACISKRTQKNLPRVAQFYGGKVAQF